MKIKKFKDVCCVSYCFYNGKTHTYHGLLNKVNKSIGYQYQDKMKGFWLKNNKF